MNSPYVDQSERQTEWYQPPQAQPPLPPPQKQPPQAPPPLPHRQATSDKPGIAPRIAPVDAVEELGLPRHSSGYSHVTFDESAMLEVMANIKDDAVYAAEKRKRGAASASGTDAGRARKQQVVSNASEPLTMPDTSMPPPPNPSRSTVCACVESSAYPYACCDRSESAGAYRSESREPTR